MPVILLISFILLLLLAYFGLKFQRKRYNERLMSSEIEPEWVVILQENISLYKKLPFDLRKRLHGLINVFIHNKNFSGYNGLEITDEIKVTIAAQACMLLLNRDEELYPSLKNIFVYPGAFRSMQSVHYGMVKTLQESVRVGESWHLGHVVLSWRHSKQGGLNDHDGHNVVYHEFAHQLDHQDGLIDGTPVLDTAENYHDWSIVFSKEFEKLRIKVSRHQKTWIDSYGAMSEGEFFAVVTEMFFEKPKLFKKEHAKLYRELEKYYHLSPVEWF